ncbi:glutamine amidotransferase [Alcanivorax quisquiliarum]|uniref:Glutamine amidotransferase n=1 Tax=Alcanivorax quisquiliarum TaxID=2933565 RepID=A0ABT0E6U8_9GAMM|nr:glutamine amidotransferase [Alcanivorax quisquiliarum]MCK0537536.1 glutamine amidotransferase [Alcanivorax quisquiliarum]
MLKPIIIVSAGQPPPAILGRHGDFSDWIAAGLGPALPVAVLDARTAPSLPAVTDIAAVVVTGSPSMVTDHESWSERLAGWLRELVHAEVPVLGICYGHQLLAYALGGEVGYRAGGLALGTDTVQLTAGAVGDALLDGLPARFPAPFVHRQSVLRLPPGACRLAGHEPEPCQMFRIGQRAWGVQFHPEFSATVMREYVQQLAPEPDAPVLARSVQETPHAAAILSRFAALSAAGTGTGCGHTGSNAW